MRLELEGLLLTGAFFAWRGVPVVQGLLAEWASSSRFFLVRLALFCARLYLWSLAWSFDLLCLYLGCCLAAMLATGSARPPPRSSPLPLVTWKRLAGWLFAGACVLFPPLAALSPFFSFFFLVELTRSFVRAQKLAVRLFIRVSAAASVLLVLSGSARVTFWFWRASEASAVAFCVYLASHWT